LASFADVAEKRPNQVLVDVGGVGYLVQCRSPRTPAAGELHTEVTLLIHTTCAKMPWRYYGFVSSAKTFF